ncbi:P-loop containing nucleoside triphosphate hydrolase protein [Pyrenochaeta sp. DS3sAY3a]|nr:P-loop containing nucleoside triphosphate hydrolase protein [Pyrenochaeta sp. DS3sAY3a]
MDVQEPLLYLIEIVLPHYKKLWHQYQWKLRAILAVAALLRACAFVFEYPLSRILATVVGSVTSSIRIDNTHVTHAILLEWASRKFADSRTLQAIPARPDDEEVLEEDVKKGNLKSSSEVFHAQKNDMIIRYSPDCGHYLFGHGARLFLFRREHINATTRNRSEDKEVIVLSTLGRNVKPIQDFIKDITDQSRKGREKMWRARPRGGPPWLGTWKDCGYVRPRPMDTVIMDEKLKTEILEEMSEYLKASTADWYAARGIPWRRGYIFYGAPGTGKTSFAMALARYFGLDIYTFAPSDDEIDDTHVITLFADIPRRCIVLLEDIDAAGLGQARMPKNERHNDGEKVSGCTLSGLLNAIDGPMSKEGRILIVSSNLPDKLDKALTRPGRLDRKIEFSLVKKDTARKMFSIFFQEAPADLANSFAAMLQEDKFSPAEVQEYLIQNKHSPTQAAANVKTWSEKLLTGKENKLS